MSSSSWWRQSKAMLSRQMGNKSMRICYVADGASIHTQRWVNYFAKNGHETHLICWKVMPGYEDNVNIHILTRLAPKIWTVSQYFSFLFWILQVRRLIKGIKPDIVDGHFITRNFRCLTPEITRCKIQPQPAIFS